MGLEKGSSSLIVELGRREIEITSDCMVYDDLSIVTRE